MDVKKIIHQWNQAEKKYSQLNIKDANQSTSCPWGVDVEDVEKVQENWIRKTWDQLDAIQKESGLNAMARRLDEVGAPWNKTAVTLILMEYMAQQSLKGQWKVWKMKWEFLNRRLLKHSPNFWENDGGVMKWRCTKGAIESVSPWMQAKDHHEKTNYILHYFKWENHVERAWAQAAFNEWINQAMEDQQWWKKNEKLNFFKRQELWKETQPMTEESISCQMEMFFKWSQDQGWNVIEWKEKAIELSVFPREPSLWKKTMEEVQESWIERWKLGATQEEKRDIEINMNKTMGQQMNHWFQRLMQQKIHHQFHCNEEIVHEKMEYWKKSNEKRKLTLELEKSQINATNNNEKSEDLKPSIKIKRL